MVPQTSGLGTTHLPSVLKSLTNTPFLLPFLSFRDEEDGILLEKEREAEKEAIAAAVRQFKKRAREGKGEGEETEEGAKEEEEEERLLAQSLIAATESVAGGAAASAATSAAVKAHVPVPCQEDIMTALMEKKKRALLSKYG